MSDAHPSPVSSAVSSDDRVPALRLAALFLLSAGLLLFQVALTKIFSIVLWYHFGFLVISIALLGFAMSGVWLSARPELVERGAALLAKLSGQAALATGAALWLVVHTQVDAFSILADHNEGALLFQVLVLLVPFFFLGAVVSATLTMHRTRAGRVYSANLIGSGAGCAAALFLFDLLHWSAPDAVLASALAMGVAGLLYALTGGLRGALWPVVGTAVLGLALFSWEERDEHLHLIAPKSKPLWHIEQWDREHRPQEVTLPSGEVFVFRGDYRVEGDVAVAYDPYGRERRIPLADLPRTAEGRIDVRDSSLVHFTEWTSLSRVDAFTWPFTQPWGLWGLSSAYQGTFPLQKGITIDSWAMTNVMRWEGGETGAVGEPPELLEYLPASLVHRIAPNAEILCIGAGGGMDLLTAKRFGAERIVGVEINPSVVAAAREAFPAFGGHLYDPERNPEVTVHVAEGRHWLERDPTLYDVVQLSGVDTASTTQAGAFALSENFLYTLEAFDTYLAHTKEDGIVTLTRWFLPDREGAPRNTLRLFVLGWRALERAGVEDPSRHVYLVESAGFSVILFGRQPFTDEQLATLDATVAQMRFRPLYHPAKRTPMVHDATKAPIENRFEAFAAAPDKDVWLAGYRYDVAAPTDDRPFFFETSRFDDLLSKDSFFNSLGGVTAHGILAVLLGLLALVGWAFVIKPLRRITRASGVSAVRELPTLVYFACLGLGFILVEVVLSQKFILYLGNPLYALAVVLFSVLVFSGIGSAFSSRVREPRRALAVVVVLALVYPWLTDVLFDLTLLLPTSARIAVAVVLLAPLATAMGMPFPLGIGRIAARGTSTVAWAWGVNGYTSVVGSVLTVVLSIAFGFTAVVWTGAALYALAFVVSGALGRGEARARVVPASAPAEEAELAAPPTVPAGS